MNKTCKLVTFFPLYMQYRLILLTVLLCRRKFLIKRNAMSFKPYFSLRNHLVHNLNNPTNTFYNKKSINFNFGEVFKKRGGGFLGVASLKKDVLDNCLVPVFYVP